LTVNRLRMDRIARLIATGLYTGYSPVAPGTAGSLLVLAILLFVHSRFSWNTVSFGLGLGLAPLFFIGVRVSGIVEKAEVQRGGRKDPSIVNIDEIVGTGLSVIFLPPSVSKYWLIAGFFLFRMFDIVKPFPVGRLQRLKGGWGIMMDDVAAGIYANVMLQILVRWIG
jgi:phosphatidylglycerophosphatase A